MEQECPATTAEPQWIDERDDAKCRGNCTVLWQQEPGRINLVPQKSDRSENGGFGDNWNEVDHMRKHPVATIGVALVTLLGGCVSRPIGPSVAVMPAPNKPFEIFQQDQGVCTQFADQQVAGGAEWANSDALSTAVITTILGAGLGAAAGGGTGAAIGAASGAVVGTALGTAPAGASQYDLQQRYDMAYSQCMYAKGNQVPGYYYAPPGASFPPPPPPPRSGG